MNVLRKQAANLVTLFSGAAAVVAMAIEPGPVAAVLLVAGQVLDALDGWLARRLGTASQFGAALDWAVDAGVALTLLGLSGRMWLLLFLAPVYAWAACGRGRSAPRASGEDVLVHWAVARIRRFSGRSLAVTLVIVEMLA